jgi:hypothetical protein
VRRRGFLLLLVFLGLGSRVAPAEPSRGINISEGAQSEPVIGKQYLVVIAISDYQEWPPLTGPVPDASEIKDILVSRYRIDRVYELYDQQATKANIMRLLVRLQEELRSEDSLLILYAGHGHLDRSSSTGFWIPVNAGTDAYEQQNWLPHTQLRGLFSNIKASHLFVVSDSCFAGDLIQATRSLPVASGAEYYRKAYSLVSRQVLASGADGRVPDSSEFAQLLKSVLKRNENPCLDAFSLYQGVRLGVSGALPLLGSLPGTGHQEGGSFLLFLKEGAEKALGSPEAGQGWLGPPRREPQAKAGWVPSPFFSTDLALGVSFPIGPAAKNALGEPCVWSSGLWNIPLRQGAVGIGVSTGTVLLHAQPGVYSYDVLAFPVALAARYTLPFRLPIWFALAAGVMPSETRIHETGSESTVTKVFVAPTIGLGVARFGHFRIGANLGFLVIFYDVYPFMGVIPEVRVEYAF